MASTKQKQPVFNPTTTKPTYEEQVKNSLFGGQPVVINDPMGDKVKQTQEAQKKQADYEKQLSKIPQVYRNQGGNLSGIEVGGKTYLGLSPDEVNKISEDYYQKMQNPQGTIKAGTLPTAQEYQQMKREQEIAASQVGQMGELGTLTATPLDYSQALKQGLAGAVPKAASYGANVGGGLLAASMLGGAKIGGTAGAAAGPIGIGTGTAIGAALGAVSGIVGGIQSNIKSQKVDNVNAQKRVLDEGKQDLNDLVRLMEKYPERRTEILKTYNAKATQIRRAHAQIKINTQNDLFEYESAIPDLAEFDAFFSYGGEFDNLNTEMQLAITQGALNPDVQIQEIFAKYGYE